MNGVMVGLGVFAAVVIGYTIAVRRRDFKVFWGTLIASALVTAGTFGEVLFVAWMDIDNALALAMFAIFLWLPGFVIAPVVAAVLMSRPTKQRGNPK